MQTVRCEPFGTGAARARSAWRSGRAIRCGAGPAKSDESIVAKITAKMVELVAGGRCTGQAVHLQRGLLAAFFADWPRPRRPKAGARPLEEADFLRLQSNSRAAAPVGQETRQGWAAPSVKATALATALPDRRGRPFRIPPPPACRHLPARFLGEEESAHRGGRDPRRLLSVSYFARSDLPLPPRRPSCSSAPRCGRSVSAAPSKRGGLEAILAIARRAALLVDTC